jgi:hypothetical protein
MLLLDINLCFGERESERREKLTRLIIAICSFTLALGVEYRKVYGKRAKKNFADKAVGGEKKKLSAMSEGKGNGKTREMRIHCYSVESDRGK